MSDPVALLAVFQPDAPTRARLRDAVARTHDTVHCPDWSMLWKTVIERNPAGVIVDPYNTFHPVTFSELVQLRGHFPGLSVIIYGDFTGRELDLYRLGRLGADGVILAGRDDRRRCLRNGVETALSAALARRVATALDRRLPPVAGRCVGWAIQHSNANPRVPDLARALQTSPRALSRELRHAKLPPPGHLLLWGRLFQAARMMCDGDVTAEHVAFHLGYATAASLGRALREQCDLSPTGFIDGRHDVDDVLQAFLDSLPARAAADERGQDLPEGGDGERPERRRRWRDAGPRAPELGSFPRP